MSFFTPYLVPQPSGPRVEYLTIFNPTLSHNDSDTDKSLLLHYSPGREYTMDEKLRHIGLIQGLNSFSSTFAAGSPVELVKTDKTCLAIVKLPDEYFMAMCVRLAQMVDSKGELVYSDAEMPPDYVYTAILEKGHALFTLHHGKIADLTPTVLEGWWSRYLKECVSFSRWSCHDRLPHVRKSSTALLNATKNRVNGLAKHALVFNFGKKEHGFVYQASDSVSSADLWRIYTWLETVHTSAVLAPENLIGDVPIGAKAPAFDPTVAAKPRKKYAGSMFSFSPVKAMNQLGSLTMSVMSTAANFNRWFEPPEAVEEVSSKGAFLVGLHETLDTDDPDMHKTITTKQVYLGEALIKHNLVIYRLDDSVVVLVYDGETQLLVNSFYTKLEAALIEMFDGEMSTSTATISSHKPPKVSPWSSLVKGGMDTLSLFSTLEAPEASLTPFYYYVYNCETRFLETSLPPIPETDSTEQYDILKSATAAKYVHALVAGIVDSTISERLRKPLISLEETIVKTEKNWLCYHTVFSDEGGDRLLVLLKAIPCVNPIKQIIEGNTSPHLIRMMGHEVQVWLDYYKLTGEVVPYAYK
ncbi:hypothetical protein BABINDRAFT_175730 [Babjeviella inositovora NRRL Y-12698]|uniref:CCZ1/INTU/HSP4 first Longin domain-containing protein n=1 Tax=Babjeviella inositovora NRRL Y-12698 TaxID=984486 RepID=A0A1E3QRP2_9ASCO|nr:uncharacterized protein BABINDRAFT_175730 [Babjeviella inositovora NRRL Y-12698]ODQ80330.1 hypothetical protein BABINDRAFT_175730 [Babjeviella inositovora NRRL Y-12698]